MNQGEVIGIYVTSVMGKPLTAVSSIKAIPGKGLEGDRYFGGKGTYLKRENVMTSEEATLIESEAIEAIRNEHGIELQHAESRRNIVTRGVRLNDLMGQEFMVGSVRMRGIRLCEPCNHLEKLTQQGVLKALVHRGGLRAQILTEGVIQTGDPVQAAKTNSKVVACA